MLLRSAGVVRPVKKYLGRWIWKSLEKSIYIEEVEGIEAYIRSKILDGAHQKPG